MSLKKCRVLLYIMQALLVCQAPLFSDVEKTIYHLTNDPIDVVIPCTEKDLPTLELCIQAVRKYGKNINRVIVVSDKRYTDSAEWFDEKLYPFSKFDVALEIFGDKEKAAEFQKSPKSRLGWIYQQFLKLYLFSVIPKISPNVLVLDADTIFLNPIQFVDSKGHALLTGAKRHHHQPYFNYANRVIPWWKKVHPRVSGICNFMLFQKAVVKDLFKTIKAYHPGTVWKSLCHCIERAEAYESCMSEYELYFNFAQLRSDQMKVIKRKWRQGAYLGQLQDLSDQGYDFVSCHSYMRKS